MAEIFAPQLTRPLKRKAHEALLDPIEPTPKKRNSIEKAPIIPLHSIESWLEEFPVDTALRDRRYFSRSDMFLLKMSETTRQSFEMETAPTAPTAQSMLPPPTPPPRPHSEDAMRVLQDMGSYDEMNSVEIEALKNAVRQPNYRDILTDHGVHISYFGIGAPREVFDVA